MDFIEDLQSFVDTLPQIFQFVTVFVIGLVPFLEGDVAALVGIVAGVPWPLVLIAGAVGTSLATSAAMSLGARVGDRRKRGERDRKVLHRVERWGIPIAMLLGGFFISVVLNAFIMTAAGLNRGIVLVSGIVTAVFNTLFVVLVMTGILQLWGL